MNIQTTTSAYYTKNLSSKNKNEHYNGMPSIHESSFTNPIISGFHLSLINKLMLLNVVWIAIKHYVNPIKAILGLKKLYSLRDVIRGNNKILKIVKAGGRYFMVMHSPGWPSPAYNRYIKAMLRKVDNYQGSLGTLQTVMLAITKKCPLKCEHCFEGKVLNQKESLSVNDIKGIIQQLHNNGISNIHLGGGEPLSRFNGLMEILSNSPKDIDFWISTSGYGLTELRANDLKGAGLTGVSVSIDHWDNEKHDKFRGFEGSFRWACNAVKNAQKAGLAVGLSVCTTKEFIDQNSINSYLKFAEDLGVGFIQIIKPRAVGNYEGKSVELLEKHNTLLNEFYLSANYDPKNINSPIILHHGYYQERVGCFGGGVNNLYIDTNGDIHPCPFCREKAGNAITDSIVESIIKMKKSGCQSYVSAAQLFEN